MSQITESTEDFVLGTYKREPVVFEKAKGSFIWDDKGNRFLDFFPGWGVGNIGHVHPFVKAAIKDQAGKMLHMPNNFYSPYQGELARKLVDRSFPGKVFFCNSGAEANECALKLSRAYGNKKGKNVILTARRSFHGRTLATVTLTGQEKYQKGFEPLLQGVKYFDFNSCESFDSVFDSSVCAVMVEVIQGEGGVNVGTKSFINHLREVTRKNDALLIIDEVQTGIGRTGRFFGFENFDIVPDMITLAKSLGGGVPIGATIIGEDYAEALGPGMHASTFGGNSLSCRAALAVIDAFEKEGILKKMEHKSKALFRRLKKLQKTFSFIKDVRGMGLMVGIELDGDLACIFFKKAIDRKLIVNYTAGNVLRIMPACNIKAKELNSGLNIMEEIFYELEKEIKE